MRKYDAKNHLIDKLVYKRKGENMDIIIGIVLFFVIGIVIWRIVYSSIDKKLKCDKCKRKFYLEEIEWQEIGLEGWKDKATHKTNLNSVVQFTCFCSDCNTKKIFLKKVTSIYNGKFYSVEHNIDKILEVHKIKSKNNFATNQIQENDISYDEEVFEENTIPQTPHHKVVQQPTITQQVPIQQKSVNQISASTQNLSPDEEIAMLQKQLADIEKQKEIARLKQQISQAQGQSVAPSVSKKNKEIQTKSPMARKTKIVLNILANVLLVLGFVLGFVGINYHYIIVSIGLLCVNSALILFVVLVAKTIRKKWLKVILIILLSFLLYVFVALLLSCYSSLYFYSQSSYLQ